MNVPSLAQRRNRVCNDRHDPYRSGTSHQATPVRNFHTIPFNTRRSSNRGRPITDLGNNGSSNAHSTSDNS